MGGPGLDESSEDSAADGAGLNRVRVAVDLLLRGDVRLPPKGHPPAARAEPHVAVWVQTVTTAGQSGVLRYSNAGGATDMS